MGVPLVLNAARTLVAGSLVLSLGLAPASAHMALPVGGPVGHAGFALGHGRPLTEPGFGRVGSFVLSSRNGYGWDNRGRSPWYGWGRSSWYGWSRYGRIGRGWNGWGPYGLDGWSAYSGFWGPGYWASRGRRGLDSAASGRRSGRRTDARVDQRLLRRRRPRRTRKLRHPPAQVRSRRALRPRARDPLLPRPTQAADWPHYRPLERARTLSPRSRSCYRVRVTEVSLETAVGRPNMHIRY